MNVLPDGEEHEALCPELLQLLLCERRRRLRGMTGRKHAGLIILLLVYHQMKVEAFSPGFFSDVVVIYAMVMEIAIDAWFV